MGFSIKRGMVLRTTKSLKVAGVSIAKGTRVKAMATAENDSIKVKVKDTRYPAINGEHLTTSFANVVRVERGRPEGTETPVKATAKAPAKKAAAKKASAKKAPAKKAAAKKAAMPVIEPEDVDVDDLDLDGDDDE